MQYNFSDTTTQDCFYASNLPSYLNKSSMFLFCAGATYLHLTLHSKLYMRLHPHLNIRLALTIYGINGQP